MRGAGLARLGPARGSGSTEGSPPARPARAFRPHPPQPVLMRPRPSPPCLSAIAAEPVPLHEVPPLSLLLPSCHLCLLRAWARAQTPPSPPPVLQVSQLTLALPWHLSPPPHLTVFLGFLVQNCLLPWLTPHLPPKTSILRRHTYSLLCHRPHPRSVLALMLQGGQVPRRLLSHRPASGARARAARFTSSICPGIEGSSERGVSLCRPQAAWALCKFVWPEIG